MDHPNAHASIVVNEFPWNYNIYYKYKYINMFIYCYIYLIIMPNTVVFQVKLTQHLITTVTIRTICLCGWLLNFRSAIFAGNSLSLLRNFTVYTYIYMYMYKYIFKYKYVYVCICMYLYELILYI